ncbi:sensor histidine kinase [Cryptosporangium aurantiacum]|uniref:histidine kinase n=1 Tax=Cryptosporangium aurantiacum TaxID=134849 RepID=A0A1M7RK37_9ACTN|nr:sensor histidine kinase [Cryptosporangium aurantiacum]SHN46521.1 Histidine kinase-, DNA gyrase B-, and HSP90-like ATPase [Cryptosporangium aurantiacum]
MRSRLTVLLAGALSGLVAAGGAVVLGWAGWLPGVVAPLCLVAGLVAGALGGFVPVARRHATATLTVAASVAAVGTAAAIGPAVALLALGRLPDARESRIGAAVGLGMLAVAAIAPVLLRWARRAAGRVGRGGRHTTEAVLDRFVSQAATGVPVEELLRELAVAVRRQWRASSVEIWVGDGGALERRIRVPGGGPVRADAVGVAAVERLRRVGVVGPGWLRTWVPELLADEPGPQVRAAPARHGDHLLALLVVRRARDQERFSPPDDRALAETARRLGGVLHNRQVDGRLQQTLRELRRSNAELRASRSRLVSTADAERRRIERDLHDGAQQHLVSLAVGLGLFRELRAGDDPMLDQLDALAERALADLRDLAHGVYPALLRDAGLAQALPGAVERSGLRADVDCVDERFAPEIEAALYFCCLEALQNVTKHAPGAAVTIRLWRAGDGVLTLRVADDGPGFDPAARPTGAGVQNMTDRVGAVGGELDVRSGPGAGTAVTARVPVADEVA